MAKARQWATDEAYYAAKEDEQCCENCRYGIENDDGSYSCRRYEENEEEDPTEYVCDKYEEMERSKEWEYD